MVPRLRLLRSAAAGFLSWRIEQRFLKLSPFAHSPTGFTLCQKGSRSERICPHDAFAPRAASTAWPGPSCTNIQEYEFTPHLEPYTHVSSPHSATPPPAPC